MNKDKFINNFLEFDLYKLCLIKTNTFIRFKFMSIIKQFFKSFFFSPKLHVNRGSSNLVINSYARQDIQDDFITITKSLNKPPTTIIIENFFIPNFFWFNRSNIFFLIKLYKKRYLLFSGIRDSKLLRLYNFLSFIEAVKLILIVENLILKNNIRVNNIISIMEMQFYENALIQYFRKKNCKTYAWHHGFYRFNNKPISDVNVAPINWLAGVCKFALVWGEAQANFVKKYTTQHPIIVGKPRKKFFNLLNQDKKYSYLVLLESRLRRKENIKLLKDVNDISKSIAYVKHPDDNYNYPYGFSVSHGEIESNYVVGIDTSTLIDYGFEGSNIIISKSSKILEVMTKNEKEKLSVSSINNMVYIPYNNKGKKLWNYYVSKYLNFSTLNLEELA